MHQHRQKDTDFTRNNKLTFQHLVLFLLNQVKGSLQQELDCFYQHYNGSTLPLRIIGKSAFCEARKKLETSAFKAINQLVVDKVNEDQSLKLWQGYRLYAVDGCRIRLPNDPIIIERFGCSHNGKAEQDCPMGLASACYDVMNDVIIDAKLSHSYSSERDMALNHLRSVTVVSALFLYDRGYPAFWFIKAHQERQINYCMRTPWNLFDETRDFTLSGKRQQIVWLTPKQAAKDLCREHQVSETPVKVRLVRVDLPDGVEILITSVTDRKRIHHSEFKGLYHKRWGIEEIFKRLKSRLEMENFTGKSPLAVQQDFHAKVVACNLSALLSQAAQPLVDLATKACKRRYAVNQTQALSRLKNSWVLLFTCPIKSLGTLIDGLVDMISLCREVIRPDRQNKRVKANKKKARYPVAYKRTL